MQPETMKSKLNETIEHLCEKARSENMAPPYKLSIVDPINHTELWKEDVSQNTDKEFTWTRNYPNFACDHLNVELTGANGLVISERLSFNEAPERLKEAGALAAD